MIFVYNLENKMGFLFGEEGEFCLFCLFSIASVFTGIVRMTMLL